MGPGRFELPTPPSSAVCSPGLSYGPNTEKRLEDPLKAFLVHDVQPIVRNACFAAFFDGELVRNCVLV